MPEYVVERSQAHELLTRVYHQKRERLVFATPEGSDKVRIVTEVPLTRGDFTVTTTTAGGGGGGGAASGGGGSVINPGTYTVAGDRGHWAWTQ